MKIISKRSDPTVFKIRQIRDGRDRSAVFCEGEKLVEDLFRSAWQPLVIYCIADKKEVADRIRLSADKPSLPLVTLSDSVMSYCSDLSSPPGIIALAKPPKYSENLDIASDKNPLFLVIHGIQLPQNVGALIRTAEATGVAKIFATATSADVHGAKAIRGATGSVFRVLIEKGRSFESVVNDLKSNSVMLVAATQHGQISYDRIQWNQPIALVVGSEGSGFTSEEMSRFDQTVKIPMQGGVESINVGSAAAVCLFEAARQRNFK